MLRHISPRQSQYLKSGIAVVLFPEGTSTDGHSVLPFRPSMMEPALALGSTITPAAVCYRIQSGAVERDVCYWGDMALLPHLLNLLSLPKIDCELRFDANLRGCSNRKAVAEVGRERVAQLLSTQDPIFDAF